MTQWVTASDTLSVCVAGPHLEQKRGSFRIPGQVLCPRHAFSMDDKDDLCLSRCDHRDESQEKTCDRSLHR